MFAQLLASSAWYLDLAFFLILLLGTALGAYRGFIKGVCKLTGRIFSLLFAVLFCVSFANFLETCFHMTTAIASGIASSIAKRGAYGTAFPADVEGALLSDALAQIGIGAFPRWLIAKCFSKVELIPAGTTPAALIGSVLGKWISIAIAFILLILIFRLGVLLISKVFGAIKDQFAPLRVVDQILGAILGFFEGCVLVFFVLMLCNWLPIASLHAWIESSSIVGKIFVSNWFQSLTSYAVSGEWFTQFLQKVIPQ